jgi:hypothetical protein
MGTLAPHLRELLGLLCANHRRGLVLARTAILPARVRSEIGALRQLGLVASDSFRPSEGAFAMFEATPATSGRGGARVKGVWEMAERQRRFIAALRETGSYPKALKAVGSCQSGPTDRRLHALRAGDPDFARRWDEALEQFRAAARPAPSRRRSTGVRHSGGARA